jgi:hypothetical protein
MKKIILSLLHSSVRLWEVWICRTFAQDFFY